MRREQNDPLPFQLWLAQLGELSKFCAVAPSENEDRAVRNAFHLFRLAMPAIRSFADPDLSEAELERELEQSGAEAAMRLILGGRASCEILQTERPAHYRASLSYDAGHVAYGEGSSRALALVSAWSNWLALPK